MMSQVSAIGSLTGFTWISWNVCLGRRHLLCPEAPVAHTHPLKRLTWPATQLAWHRCVQAPCTAQPTQSSGWVAPVLSVIRPHEGPQPKTTSQLSGLPEKTSCYLNHEVLWWLKAAIEKPAGSRAHVVNRERCVHRLGHFHPWEGSLRKWCSWCFPLWALSFLWQLNTSEVIWEEGISFEEMPLWDLPIGERAQLTVDDATLWQVGPGLYKKSGKMSQ